MNLSRIPAPTLHTEPRLQIPHAHRSCHLGRGTHSALAWDAPRGKEDDNQDSSPCPQLPQGIGQPGSRPLKATC